MTFREGIKRTISLITAVALLLTVSPLFGTFAESAESPWLWPVPGSYQINSLDIYFDDGLLHSGGQAIDIGANGYTGANRLDVVSATSGEVFFICNKYSEMGDTGSGWGNYVIIESDGVKIVYAHLQSVSVKYGKVEAGQVIGKMGMTGNSTGVHLHVQAYPSGKASSSTDIHVFDKYINNPFYYQNYRFAKGLENSPLYGAHIKNYYKTVSGGYYIYSGGLDTDFEVNPVLATVKVIASSGAPIRKLPLNDNSLIVDTASKGESVGIIGTLKDAYGRVWAKTDGGKWIDTDLVGFYEYNEDITASDVVLPAGLCGGLYEAGICGTLKSGNVIKSLVGEILVDDEVIYTHEESVGSVECDVNSVLSKNLMTHVLSDGDYGFRLYAVLTASYPGQDDLDAKKLISSSSFSVDSSLADTTSPVIEKIDILSVEDGKIEVLVTLPDGRAVSSVTANGAVLEPVSDREYKGTVSFADGSNVIKAVVTDTHGNTASRTRGYITAIPTGEMWEVKYSGGLNVRKTPSKNGAKASYSVKCGDILHVIDLVDAESRTWCMLEDGNYINCINGTTVYAAYSSGFNCAVNFDLNGGTWSLPSNIPKCLSSDAVIPAIAPEREGLTFLGWGVSSNATEIKYDPGDTVTGEGGEYLFAIWEDKTAPVIEGVSLSPEGWTNGNVTVSVNASDDSGEVLYSFDGGETWSDVPYTSINKNCTVEAGRIAVRDVSGNTASYGSAVEINFIDKTSPDVSEGKTAAKVSGSKATFDVTGVTDSESGIGKTEVLLSLTRDFTVSKSYDITEEKTLTLANSVYYGKIRITDRAGNISFIPFDRFAVGTVSKLETPSAPVVNAVGSAYCELVWGGITNADGYIVEFDIDGTFTSPDVIPVFDEKVTVNGLEPSNTYFARVKAVSNDGIYPESEFSEPLELITLSDDSLLYGFVSLTDVNIDGTLNVCDYIADYKAAALDISVITDEKSTAEYYSSPALVYPVSADTVKNYPFTEQNDTVYIKITAENGTYTLYTLRINRAGQSAAVPNIELDRSKVAEKVNVGTSSGGASVSAYVTDGGKLSFSWLLSDGTTEKEISTEKSVSLGTLPAGNYSLYCVITNENGKCEITSSSVSTDKITFAVEKFTPTVTLKVSDKVYDGVSVNAEVSGYKGDGLVAVTFYTDEELMHAVDKPKDTGTYYAVAVALETDTWKSAVSQTVKFTVSKAENTGKPVYTLTPPTPRETTASLEITSKDVEYKLGGGEWKDYVSVLSLVSNDKVSFRFKETKNVNAGQSVTIDGMSFAGYTDIVTNGQTLISVDDGNILVLEDISVDLSYLKSGLCMSEYIHFYNASGVEITSDDTLITTAAKVTLEDKSGVIKTSAVIILGDVNCDGFVTKEDGYEALRFSNKMKTPENEYVRLAADYDGNGIITSTDALLIATRS